MTLHICLLETVAIRQPCSRCPERCLAARREVGTCSTAGRQMTCMNCRHGIGRHNLRQHSFLTLSPLVHWGLSSCRSVEDIPVSSLWAFFFKNFSVIYQDTYKNSFQENPLVSYLVKKYSHTVWNQNKYPSIFTRCFFYEKYFIFILGLVA